MPELPDLIVYIEGLQREIVNQRLDRILIHSPFVLRSVEPPLDAITAKVVRHIDRLGKRIVIEFADDLFLVLHLMIAGRLKWAAGAPDGPDVPTRRGAAARPSPKITLATLEFSTGTLFFTEAGSKKRASLIAVRGRDAVRALDPGGLEPLGSSLEEFRERLARDNHTLKRALTDPHLFSGIGNAYSDEILHAARLSPIKLSRSLTAEESRRLHEATSATLTEWVERLRAQFGVSFPAKVTAFRPEMAVHGRFRQPCPVCGAPVQRIVYASNECNYCARCQTGGRLLADRSLSRLLKDAWPRSIDDL